MGNRIDDDVAKIFWGPWPRALSGIAASLAIAFTLTFLYHATGILPDLSWKNFAFNALGILIVMMVGLSRKRRWRQEHRRS